MTISIKCNITNSAFEIKFYNNFYNTRSLMPVWWRWDYREHSKKSSPYGIHIEVSIKNKRQSGEKMEKLSMSNSLFCINFHIHNLSICFSNKTLNIVKVVAVVFVDEDDWLLFFVTLQNAVQADEDLRLLKLRDVVQQLPPPHYRSLEYLMRHLSKVAAHGFQTGMTPKNVAIVWAPNLLR